MDARRIIESLRERGKFLIGEHIALSEKEHSNMVLEGNPLEGIDPNKRDSLLYVIANKFYDFLSNTNVSDILSLTENDELSKTVANRLKVTTSSIYTIGYKSGLGHKRYAIISSLISEQTLGDINKFIERYNEDKYECVFVGCLASEYDVDFTDCMASSYHSIIYLPKTEFYDPKKCPLCLMGKPLFIKKEDNNGYRPESPDDRRRSASSGTGVPGKESAGSVPVRTPPPGPKRHNLGREHAGSVAGNSIPSVGKQAHGGDRSDNLNGDFTRSQEASDGKPSEQPSGVRRGGGEDQAGAIGEKREAGSSGLSFVDNPELEQGGVDAESGEHGGGGRNNGGASDGDLTL